MARRLRGAAGLAAAAARSLARAARRRHVDLPVLERFPGGWAAPARGKSSRRLAGGGAGSARSRGRARRGRTRVHFGGPDGGAAARRTGVLRLLALLAGLRRGAGSRCGRVAAAELGATL